MCCSLRGASAALAAAIMNCLLQKLQVNEMQRVPATHGVAKMSSIKIWQALKENLQYCLQKFGAGKL